MKLLHEELQALKSGFTSVGINLPNTGIPQPLAMPEAHRSSAAPTFAWARQGKESVVERLTKRMMTRDWMMSNRSTMMISHWTIQRHSHSQRVEMPSWKLLSVSIWTKIRTRDMYSSLELLTPDGQSARISMP